MLMPITITDAFSDSTVSAFINTLIDETFENVRSERDCPKFTDRQFIRLNIIRCLHEIRSGRAFLQELDESFGEQCEFAHYYDALHSERRLAMLKEFHGAFLNTAAVAARENEVDYLDAFPELKDRRVIAADGHYHKHASHAERAASGKLIPSGTIYTLDLHTGTVAPLAVVQTAGKKHHEIKILRKCLPELNRGYDKKPIVVYDLAIQDNGFFADMKLATGGKGVDIITKLKSNIIPTFEQSIEFDKSLDANVGVTKVSVVGLNNGSTARVIYYTNPEDDESYQFLTTVDDIEPGVIAWIYLRRWDIEKIYDVKKNKLMENKSWATGKTAQQIQDYFVAIALNLLQLILKLFEAVFGIREDKLEKKREAWLKKREEKARKKGGYLHPLVRKTRHMYQLSLQFIRSVRNHFFNPKTISQLLPKFTDSLTRYLGT